MYRYVVTRRWRQSNGEWGKQYDFRYAKGIKDVRRLCGNIGKPKIGYGAYEGTVMYSGDNGKMMFKAVRCGEWR